MIGHRHPSPRIRQMLIFFGKPIHERRAIVQEQRRIQLRDREVLRDAIARRDGRCCACCGETKNLVLDHILPVSKGGLTILPNMQLLCKSCDKAKANQIIDYRGMKR